MNWIFFVSILFISFKISAQNFGLISYSSKHGINGMDSENESVVKSEYRIYKFELTRDKILYWEGHRRREFEIESITETRFYFKNKPWQIKIIGNGTALLWIWGNKTDTVFTHVIENKLYNLKPMERIWQQQEMISIGGLNVPERIISNM